MAKPPEILFQKIWELWPNKKDKLASQKAFEWGHSQKWFSVDELSACVQLYVKSETNLVKEKQTLGNWIRENKYQQLLERIRSEGFDQASKQQKERNKEAVRICEVWNDRRRSWWQEIIDIEDRAKSVEKALEDQFFRDNWERGLDYLRAVFRNRRTESDYLRTLIPSITWFANREHNVLAKILEGEYGRPPRREEQFVSPYSSSDGTNLNLHGEDLIQVVKMGMVDPFFKQEVTMLRDMEAVEVDWYVIENSKGYALKYRGISIDKVKVESEENRHPIFSELRQKAIDYNNSGYKPNLKKQTETQVKEGAMKKQCPL